MTSDHSSKILQSALKWLLLGYDFAGSSYLGDACYDFPTISMISDLFLS